MHLTRRLIIVDLSPDSALAVNTLSGAVDILAGDTLTIIRALRSGSALPPHWESSDICSQLQDRGYLFASPDDEEVYLQRLFQMHEQRRRQTTPTQFALCPTMACNLQCQYCFQSDDLHVDNAVMTDEMVDAAFSSFEPLKARISHQRPHTVILFGGEPLLPVTVGAITRIVDNCVRGHHRLEIVTNGVNLAQFVPTLLPAAELLAQIQVTLDGPPGIHDQRRCFRSGKGSYRQIASGIDAALTAEMPITVRVNLDRGNVASIGQMISDFQARGWTEAEKFSCYFFPVTHRHGPPPPHILGEHEIVSLLQNEFSDDDSPLGKYMIQGMRVLSLVAGALDPDSIKISPAPMFTYCEAAGLGYFGFTPDGNIYPCGQAIGDPDAAIGQFYPQLEIDETRAEAWSTRSVFTIPQCRDCDMATLCGGGCAYMALRDHGRLHAPSCQNARETLVSYIETQRQTIISNIEEGA